MLRTETISELKAIYDEMIRVEAERAKIELPDIRFSFDISTLDMMQHHVRYSIKECVPFNILLSRLIEKSGFQSDPEFYNKCGISRQHFSKIMGCEPYTPKKKTVMAIALTLKLSLEDAKELLSSAGYSFTRHDKTDILIQYCLEHQLFDLTDINEALMIFQERPLLE